MRERKNLDGSGPSIKTNEPQSQNRYESRSCDSCWNPVFTRIGETAVCETHARASGVIQ